MSAHRSLLLFATVASVIALAATLRGNAPPQRGISAIIATVDLERVFNKMTDLKDAETLLTTKMKPLLDQAEALKKKAEQLKQDVDALAPGTKKHDEAMAALSRTAWDYQAQIEFNNAKFDAARGEARSALFQVLLDSAAAFAQAEGIHLIVANDSKLPLQAGTDIQVVQQLALRRVVFADNALDVTDALIEWINTH